MSMVGSDTYVYDLTLAGESGSSVRHESLALRDANHGAQVGLAALAELALAALWNVQRHDVVSNGNASDALADALDDSRALVTQNDGENGLGVLSRQQVRVSVAQSGAHNLDANLSGLRGGYLDFLHG